MTHYKCPDYARKFDVEYQLRLIRPDITVVDSLVDLADQVHERFMAII